MTFLKKIENFIFEEARGKFIFITFLFLLFKTGIAFQPSFVFNIQYTIAQNPFVNTIHEARLHYIFWSWLGPFLAWLTGFSKSKELFFLFCSSFSFGFFILCIRLLLTRLPDSLSRTSFVLFTILPVASVTFYCPPYDPLLLFLMALALNFPHFIVGTFFIGLALGMQHFELTLFAFGALLAWSLKTHVPEEQHVYKTSFCLSLLAGSFVGKAILMTVFKMYHIPILEDRIITFKDRFAHILLGNYYNFQIILWTCLGMGWFIAIKYAEIGRRTTFFFCILFSLIIILVFSTQDTMRILAIASFPLLTASWLTSPSFLEKFEKEEVSFLFLLWALFPFIWTITNLGYTGSVSIYTTHFSSNLTYIVKTIFHILNVST